MARYKHVIWDWNGTLLADVAVTVDVVNFLLDQRGLARINEEQYREWIDLPIQNFYRRIGFDFEAESFDGVVNGFGVEYARRLPECKIQDGALEALRVLSEAGVTHSVLSATNQEQLGKSVEYFGLGKWLIKSIGLDDCHGFSKVENGKKWVEKLAYGKDQVVIVGDMLHDHEVAGAIGIDCVLLTGGHNSTERLAKCGVPMFDTMGEVVEWLMGSD